MKNRKKILLLQCILTLCCFTLFAQVSKPTYFWSDRLQRLVDGIVADTANHCQGIIVRIRKGEEWEWTGSSGISNKLMEKADTDMVFRAASVTKMFTSIATLKMVEKGFLSLDDTITNYLPLRITRLITHAKKITIKDLLYHRSGLEDFQAVNGGKWLEFFLANPTKSYSIEYLIGLTTAESLEPPADENYSNTNYLLLGLILDSVYTAGDYHDLVKKEIIEPFGLKNTFFEKDTITNVPSMGSDYYLEPLSWYASADIITSTKDLVILHDALLKKRILSNYLTQKMIDPHPKSNLGLCMGYAKYSPFGVEGKEDFFPERWGIDGVFPVSISENYYIPSINTFITFNAYPDISSSLITPLYNIIKKIERDSEGIVTPTYFSVYPNSFNEKIIIELYEPGLVQIRDMVGNVKYSRNIVAPETITIPTISFSKGVYIAGFICLKTKKSYKLSIIKE